jgi:hypothetical protein
VVPKVLRGGFRSADTAAGTPGSAAAAAWGGDTADFSAPPTPATPYQAAPPLPARPSSPMQAGRADDGAATPGVRRPSSGFFDRLIGAFRKSPSDGPTGAAGPVTMPVPPSFGTPGPQPPALPPAGPAGTGAQPMRAFPVSMSPYGAATPTNRGGQS